MFTCEACTFINENDGSSCVMCGTPRASWSAGVDDSSENVKYGIPLHEYDVMRLSVACKYPLLRSPAHLEKLPELFPAIVAMFPHDEDDSSDDDPAGKEFSFAMSFSPRYVIPAIRLGVFPMSINIWKTDIPAYKLHRERMILDPVSRFIPPVGMKKKCKKFYMKMNSSWDDVITMLRQEHNRCWLADGLVNALFWIRDNPDGAQNCRVYTFEVYSKSDDTLSACELGFSVGTCYTSMTGCKVVNGAGSVQLACTGQWLQNNGFECWDLGMKMDYKLTLGGVCVPRDRWQTRILEFRDKVIAPVLFEGPCRNLIGKK